MTSDAIFIKNETLSKKLLTDTDFSISDRMDPID